VLSKKLAERGAIVGTLTILSTTSVEFGSQLFLGGNTPIGPVTLSLGLGEPGNQAFYVEICRPTRGRWQ
jgi:hypothetical protein